MAAAYRAEPNTLVPWADRPHGRQLVSDDRSQRAVELLSQRYNCAQSVYAACATGEGLSEAQRLTLAAPFGGGIARQGEIWGALTGALLTLAEADGGAMAADPAAGQDAFYARAQELTEAFRSAHGSIRCRELTGCALNTDEGRRSFKERGLHQSLCVKLVAFAAKQGSEIYTCGSAERITSSTPASRKSSSV
jgi:C_GCAxxG_C_C family probable redox protein